MLVRFYAVGREIAGVDELRLGATDITELAAALEAAFGARMGLLAAAATLLHNGTRYRTSDVYTFADDDVVDLLPPFAGG